MPSPSASSTRPPRSRRRPARPYPETDRGRSMETTVVKGFKMLEALAMNEGPCALTDMAKLCGVTKRNAHRLLKTLEECRYVRHDPKTRAYEATLRLWELGIRVFNRLNLRGVAQPHLASLAQATRESVHLSMFEHGEVVYVDKG